MTQDIRRSAERSHPAKGFRHPGRIIASAFAAAVAVGTGLLSLPVAKAGEGGADFLTALFHATSAVCVTGLVTVDTGTYWSGFGQVVILLLVQVGGLGIMTLATLFALLMSRRLRAAGAADRPGGDEDAEHRRTCAGSSAGSWPSAS